MPASSVHAAPVDQYDDMPPQPYFSAYERAPFPPDPANTLFATPVPEC